MATANNNFTTKAARKKLNLLELANELSNVSKACKIMGYSRQQSSQIRTNYQTFGSEGLIYRVSEETNPLIKERYTEMSGKILHDEEEQKAPTPVIIPRKIQEKEKEVVYINSNTDSYFVINSFRITEIEDQIKLIYTLLGSIATLFLIQVIINLILLIRK